MVRRKGALLLSDYGRLVRDALHHPVPRVASKDDDELYQECMKADEVAAWLRVSRRTVYKYASIRAIPCRRLGRRVIFSRQLIALWLANALVPDIPDER